MNPIATALAAKIEGWLTRGKPVIVGLCGTQASGKSTACAQLAEYFSAKGLTVGVLSLDDLYLGRTLRAEMATAVHPLFATRGPPGTHDTAIGIATLDAIKRGNPVMLPRFDKRADEPLSSCDWPLLTGPCDLLLFEGWCVGAKPVPEELLAKAVNALEQDEDADGIWRRQWNTHLGGETAELFARIDRLAYLRPPSFEIVYQWRCQQERGYQATETNAQAAAAMTDEQVARFIAHYERLTRWIMAEMPGRADVTLQLDENRNPVSVGE
jgi:D-glycerate 3-kinase